MKPLIATLIALALVTGCAADRARRRKQTQKAIVIGATVALLIGVAIVVGASSTNDCDITGQCDEDDPRLPPR